MNMTFFVYITSRRVIIKMGCKKLLALEEIIISVLKNK